jgi:hypothetical protein
MSTKQDCGIMKLGKLIVVDGYQTHSTQTLTLHTIVDYIAKAV